MSPNQVSSPRSVFGMMFSACSMGLPTTFSAHSFLAPASNPSGSGIFANSWLQMFRASTRLSTGVTTGLSTGCRGAVTGASGPGAATGAVGALGPGVAVGLVGFGAGDLAVSDGFLTTCGAWGGVAVGLAEGAGGAATTFRFGP